jgi:hypothetical protein
MKTCYKLIQVFKYFNISYLILFHFIFLLFFIQTGNCQSTITITYDELNRISKITYSDSSNIQYSYDYGGNRITKLIKLRGKIISQDTPNSLCAGSTFNISFSIVGSYETPNNFIAQLSDTSGDFTNPIDIGSLSSTISGIINASLPSNILSGNNYRIRIISTSPQSGDNDSCSIITINHCDFTIHSKVIIEGYYIGNGHMNAVIDPINNPNLCDTITLQLHSPVSPYQLLYSEKKLLHTDGTCDFTFSTSPEYDSYYLVFKHRNSIETWSKYPLKVEGPEINFDFTRH